MDAERLGYILNFWNILGYYTRVLKNCFLTKGRYCCCAVCTRYMVSIVVVCAGHPGGLVVALECY